MACDGPMDVMGWDGGGGGAMDVMRGGDVTCQHCIYANNVTGYGAVGCCLRHGCAGDTLVLETFISFGLFNILPGSPWPL
jgi:hypothetical protein